MNKQKATQYLIWALGELNNDNILNAEYWTKSALEELKQ